MKLKSLKKSPFLNPDNEESINIWN